MIRRVCVIASLCMLTLATGARAQLTGETRSRFVARMEQECVASAADDDVFTGISRKVIISVCRCAGARVADTFDIEELRQAISRNNVSSWSRDIGMDAVQYCIDRKGGFIPTTPVTPNR